MGDDLAPVPATRPQPALSGPVDRLRRWASGPPMRGFPGSAEGRRELAAGVVAVVALLVLVFPLATTVWLAVPLAGVTYAGLVLLLPGARRPDGSVALPEPLAFADDQPVSIAEPVLDEVMSVSKADTPAISAGVEERWRAFVVRYGLTKRECEVVKLLALRLTDIEIAERLCIARKTAEHHTASALGKLGLRSRREVAAFLREHDLPVPQDDLPSP